MARDETGNVKTLIITIKINWKSFNLFGTCFFYTNCVIKFIVFHLTPLSEVQQPRKTNLLSNI